MHTRLTMLTKTSALGLYNFFVKLPKESQLLCRLGQNWHEPSPEDLPSPVPTDSRTVTKKRPSPLEALASRVPANGPRCNELAVAPWEAADWGRRLTFKTRQKDVSPQGRRTAIRTVTEECDPSVALVHVVGMITNRNRRDGKMVGAAAAVIPIACTTPPTTTKLTN